MAELAGVLVGDYFLLECLGREGMVETYRARPTTAGGYDVRLRLFRPPFPDPTAFREHFAHEVEKVWHCRHPHLEPLLEYGSGADLLYCATRCTEEETLERVLQARSAAGREDGLPLEVVIRLATQLCEALNYAHQQGVVHGNIQPASILVRSNGELLLTDFSMRRFCPEGEALSTRGAEGNPAYLAPEQALGALLPASDIYALGVLLYRLLGGVQPYEHEDPVELALQHASEPIPPLRQLRPEVPEALELVVRVAMAKQASARFASPAELGQALLESLTPEGAERLANWPRREIKVRVKRTPALWSRSLSLALLAILLLGLGSTSLFGLNLPLQLYTLGSHLASGTWFPGFSSTSGLGQPGATPTSRPTSGPSHRSGTPRPGRTPQPTPTSAGGQTPIVVFPGTPTACMSSRGALTLDSSQTLHPFLQQVETDYQASCSGTHVTLRTDGSRTALNLVQAGRLDLAYSDLSANPTRGLTDHPLAALLYALIVSPDIQVSGLSSAQLLDIYQGRVTNWAQVGGPNEAIVVIQRASTSAIRAIFQSFVLNGQASNIQGVQLPRDQASQVAQTVSQTPGALSYVPLLDAEGADVNVLALNNALPEARAVQQGTYVFWGIEHGYSRGPGTLQAQAFLAFLTRPAEANLLSQFGALSLDTLSSEIIATHLPGPLL